MTTAPTASILLLGARGQLGRELTRKLAAVGAVTGVDREELDLTNMLDLQRTVQQVRPAIIVNAAAYTAVDRAEEEREAAFSANAELPARLAAIAANLGSLLVHYSTDYVFDGTMQRAYRESDVPNPLNVYGESKLAGDEAILDSAAPHAILRTSWVYSAHGHNFLRTMLKLAHEREEIQVVDDQVGAPTPARLLAEVTARILATALDSRGQLSWPEDLSGLYNVVTRGETSWFGFTREILSLDPDRGSQRCESVLPVSSEAFASAARRPARSVLDTSKIESTFRLQMPHWKDSLTQVMSEMSYRATASSPASGTLV